MSELSWKDSIIEVLRDAAQPLSDSEITRRIVKYGLRTEFGETPARTVNSAITKSIKADGGKSPFVRVNRGEYALRSAPNLGSEEITKPLGGQTVLINAFGKYWRKDAVLWSANPKILGQRRKGANQINFSGQRGVYLLHDSRTVVYVGRATDQPLGRRLSQHTRGRLNGRWDRFSWFGVNAVTQEGSLQPDVPAHFSLDDLIVTMEALLIEGLEPPQNRKLSWFSVKWKLRLAC